MAMEHLSAVVVIVGETPPWRLYRRSEAAPATGSGADLTRLNASRIVPSPLAIVRWSMPDIYLSNRGVDVAFLESRRLGAR
jgi:hypothetical protein